MFIIRQDEAKLKLKVYQSIKDTRTVHSNKNTTI
jgi:hypothetical protein